MAEHIVAVFDSEGAAEAAVRDLEQAGISTSAIRSYRSTATSAGNENSGAISPATGNSRVAVSGHGFSVKNRERKQLDRSLGMITPMSNTREPGRRCSA